MADLEELRRKRAEAQKKMKPKEEAKASVKEAAVEAKKEVKKEKPAEKKAASADELRLARIATVEKLIGYLDHIHRRA
ncbi:MAG: hypothetical protein DRH12_02735 [Deltaproteobacteria bacterium]|nr:MAG: hypothetical protein DRH12_02735 [Deltaproteobacteria bacterium]